MKTKTNHGTTLEIDLTPNKCGAVKFQAYHKLDCCGRKSVFIKGDIPELQILLDPNIPDSGADVICNRLNRIYGTFERR